MTWCHFWTLAWHEPDCFNFFTFQPNYFEISCLLSLSQRVPKSFLEHRICRMLIDVTWKKSFEVNRFLCCWASLSASLGCVVWISEKGMRCAVFPRLMCLAWTYFCTPPLSSIFFVCLLNQVSGRLIFSEALGSKRWYLRFQNYTCFLFDWVVII